MLSWWKDPSCSLFPWPGHSSVHIRHTVSRHLFPWFPPLLERGLLEGRGLSPGGLCVSPAASSEPGRHEGLSA